MEKFVVLSGPDAGREFPLAGGATAVGRGPENEVVLRDPFVSRRHFLVRRSGDELWLEDAGGRNPVTLNGVDAREARLRSGDRITVGETELLVLALAPEGLAAGDPAASTLLAQRPAPPGGGDPFARFVGTSAALRSVIELLRRAAPLAAPVLILGETGSGKELAAEALHLASPRARGPFIEVNAAGIPASLAEAEFFGHEKGAFTGAVGRRQGQIELANGGTFFLDEVGELEAGLQAKLLRALESGAFRRVGGTEEVRSDFRIVAATNRDLAAEVKAARFRADLYYRLNVLTIRMPPLRERSEDILSLARHFAALAARECGRPEPEILEATAALLAARPWPGNARELRNAVLRAVIRSRGPRLEPRDFAGDETLTPAAPGGPGGRPGLPRSLREVEREEIERVLGYAAGNKTRAAEILGISRNTLYEKLRAFAIGHP